eukprot:CAMPEP_0183437316 /NCGR_PEP_ID=MMETSP0370-20130417/72401_1 /TAXON_ID=268820 /ORGANISM="Peridinium aciculiferum, Strain PAER-2" /LENGTH=55 /DNA_ID=CAMNT_0025625069 /DNA_START=18 /DNA_END=181 /DNA_ORIENTATION=+
MPERQLRTGRRREASLAATKTGPRARERSGERRGPAAVGLPNSGRPPLRSATAST